MNADPLSALVESQAASSSHGLIETAAASVSESSAHTILAGIPGDGTSAKGSVSYTCGVTVGWEAEADKEIRINVTPSGSWQNAVTKTADNIGGVTIHGAKVTLSRSGLTEVNTSIAIAESIWWNENYNGNLMSPQLWGTFETWSLKKSSWTPPYSHLESVTRLEKWSANDASYTPYARMKLPTVPYEEGGTCHLDLRYRTRDPLNQDEQDCWQRIFISRQNQKVTFHRENLEMTLRNRGSQSYDHGISDITFCNLASGEYKTIPKSSTDRECSLTVTGARIDVGIIYGMPCRYANTREENRAIMSKCPSGNWLTDNDIKKIISALNE
ncbi:hypothetical protein [Streptomyces sp. NPDC055709]